MAIAICGMARTMHRWSASRTHAEHSVIVYLCFGAVLWRGCVDVQVEERVHERERSGLDDAYEAEQRSNDASMFGTKSPTRASGAATCCSVL